MANITTINITTAIDNADVHTLNILSARSSTNDYKPKYRDVPFYKFKQADYIELDLSITNEIQFKYKTSSAAGYMLICVIKNNNARRVFEYNAQKNYFSLAKATTITIIGAAKINDNGYNGVPWAKEIVQYLHNIFKDDDYYLRPAYIAAVNPFGFLDCCLSTIKYQSTTTVTASDATVNVTVSSSANDRLPIKTTDYISETSVTLNQLYISILVDLEKSKNINIENYNNLFVSDLNQLLYKNSNNSYETVHGTIDVPLVKSSYKFVELSPGSYSSGSNTAYIYKTIIDGLYVLCGSSLTPDTVENGATYRLNTVDTFAVLRPSGDRRNNLTTPPNNAISDWFVSEVEPNIKGRCAISSANKPATASGYLYKINGMCITVRDMFYMVRSFVNKYYNGSSDFALTTSEDLLNDTNAPKHLIMLN